MCASIIHYSDLYGLIIDLYQVEPNFFILGCLNPPLQRGFIYVVPPRFTPFFPGERGSQWPLALELLFREMPRIAIPPNIITYSAAISGRAPAGPQFFFDFAELMMNNMYKHVIFPLGNLWKSATWGIKDLFFWGAVFLKQMSNPSYEGI
jgi:hypothetical protein